MLAKLKGQQLIQPPPDIKQIADRTAQYVAKNGSQFEDLVAKAEKDNSKFSFLKVGDPYRAYYDSKIYEYSRGNQTEKPVDGQTSSQQQQIINPIQQNIQKQIKKNNELKPPSLDRYNVDFNRSITAQELDLIKHCAQFVAKNGQKFLVALTEREKQNVQFDFLKPTHPLFSFFTSLVDSYNNCLNPKKEDILQLQENVQNKMTIFKRASERWEWENMEKASRKKKQQIDEEEKVQMAQIDWNDFVIVETIDLFDDEILPAPLLDQKNQEKSQIKIETPIHSIQQPPNITQNVEIKPVQKIVQIDNNKEIQKVKCQVCGCNIPVNEYDQHVKLELMDPKYFEIKNQIKQRTLNSTGASNNDFAQNLITFTQKRLDIYGNPLKSEDQQQNSQEIWDGQASNMTRASAGLAMLANKQNKNIKDLFENVNIIPKQPQQSIENIQFQQQQQIQNNNLLNAISLPPQTLQPLQPFLPTNLEQNQEPTLNLIPEHQWAQKFQGPIKINVKVPDSCDDEGWNLKGQVIQLQLDITSTIETIKNTMTGLLGGLPLQKQKLRTFNISNMKDNLSLAYYNIGPNTQIDLSIKERGGARKNK